MVNKNNKSAVFSILNTDSGKMSWWDDFPIIISKKLEKYGISHICYYRSFTPNSLHSKEEQNLVEGETLTSDSWLQEVNQRSKQFDKVIYHTHSYYPPNKISKLTFLRKKRYWYITEHRIGDVVPNNIKMLVRTLGRYLKLQPKKIFGVSKATVNKKKLIYGSKDCVLAYNGIRFKNNNNPPLEFKDKPKNALFVGRLIKEKGIDILLQTYKLIKENGLDYHLTIVGYGSLKDYVTQYIVDHQLQSHISFAGYDHDVSRYYKKADFLIIPSVFDEPFGLISIEGRDYCLPAIYSNRGGLIETRTPNFNGILLNDITAQDIFDSIIELTSDVEHFNEMRKNCLHDLNEFSIEKMAQVYVDAYLYEFRKSSMLDKIFRAISQLLNVKNNHRAIDR